MEVKTNGRGLKDAIDGVATTSGPVLAKALAATAELLDIPAGPDREITLHADVNTNAVTVSARVGKPIVAVTEAPWNNPHLDEVDRERQASQVAADKEEADRVRKLLKAS